MYGSDGTVVGWPTKIKLRLQLVFGMQLCKRLLATSQSRKERVQSQLLYLERLDMVSCLSRCLDFARSAEHSRTASQTSSARAIPMLPQIGRHCHRSTRQVSMQLIHPNLGTAHLRAHTIQYMLLVAPGAEPTGLAERTLFGRGCSSGWPEVRPLGKDTRTHALITV